MEASGGVSVIVRARDEESSLLRCLETIRAQSGVGETQIVFVELGSRDGSAEAARSSGASVVRTPAGPFSFGGALNLGAERCTGEVLVALSAHAIPRAPDWLERIRGALDDPQVACASGDDYGPDGGCLNAPVAPACEDKEWALHWLDRGYTCVVDPTLAVDHDHTHDSRRVIFTRARREAEGYGAFMEQEPYGTRELFAD